MGTPTGRVRGPIGQPLNLGRPKLKKPEILRDLEAVPLLGDAGDKVWEGWTRVVQFVDPPLLRQILADIYGSGRWADPSHETGGGNRTGPRRPELPDALRERREQGSGPSVTLRLDPDFSVEDAVLNGVGKFVLRIPTSYPKSFDSPLDVRVRVSKPQADSRKIGAEVGLGVAHDPVFGVPLFGAKLDFRLHYDSVELVKAAASVLRDRGYDRETVEQLLSAVRLDVSGWVWALILPAYVEISTSSLLPQDRPLHGTKQRLLPPQIAAMPDSEILNIGMILIPKGVFFDTLAPGGGVHWSHFGLKRGFSLTGGLTAKLDTEKMRANVLGYADLYYVERVSDTVDLGVGLTYAVDPFSKPADPRPAHLDYKRARYKPWLPTSRSNVAPAEDLSGHRIMFSIRGTHDIF